MPRERIKYGSAWIVPEDDNLIGQSLTGYKRLEPADSVPPGHVLRTDPSFDVTWSRHNEAGHVQLAFEAPRDWWDRFFLSIEGSPNTGEFTCYTEQLSRSEINHMIKTLRRARDAAYGADE